MTPLEEQPHIEGAPALSGRATRVKNILSVAKRTRILVTPFFSRTRLVVATIFTLLVGIATHVPKLREFYGPLFFPDSNTEIHRITSNVASINVHVQNTGHKSSHLTGDCGLAFGNLQVMNAMLEIHPDDMAKTTISPGPPVTIRLTTTGLSTRVRKAGLPERVTKEDIKKQLDAPSASIRQATVWVDVDESNGRCRRLFMRISISRIRGFILEGLP